MSDEGAFDASARKGVDKLTEPKSYSDKQIHSNLDTGTEIELMLIGAVPTVMKRDFNEFMEDAYYADAEIKLLRNEQAADLAKMNNGSDAKEKSQLVLDMDKRADKMAELETHLMSDEDIMEWESMTELCQSLPENYFEITMARGGKRNDQVVDVIKALVTREENQLEALMGERKYSRFDPRRYIPSNKEKRP